MEKILQIITNAKMRPLREKIQIIFRNPYASLNPKKKIVQSVNGTAGCGGKIYEKKKKLEKGTGRSSGRSVSVIKYLEKISA